MKKGYKETIPLGTHDQAGRPIWGPEKEKALARKRRKTKKGISMKPLLTTIALITITGCTTAEQKLENYRKLGEMAANPKCVSVSYSRDGYGNDARRSFKEIRCSGDNCECGVGAQQ